ncbi:MAG TPA: hypothetical protein VNE40_02865 [Candidatus Dormibacteraeota bacterium]|nr:hypothetical protein [Candidatus Dormibacteraeota bacterium]
MNPETGNQPTTNPLQVAPTSNSNIFELKRHSIGLLGIHLGAGFLLAIVAALAFVVAPMVLKNQPSSRVLAFGALVFMVVALFVVIFVLISNKVYRANKWILTADSLTQIKQTSLLDRQSSQLSLGNLEDVSVSQDGILSHMLNFGTLQVETAGEHSKFVFPYCPKPAFYSQQILSAREAFEQGRRAAPFGNQDLNQAATPLVPSENPNINSTQQ